jgi:uncharacterized protein YdhG (YjbR/CyaY superfamily)
MKRATVVASRVNARAETVQGYIAALPRDARAALTSLRRIIRAAAPMATEAISYAMPAFKHRGALVYYAAFKDHCSFFPASVAVMRRHAAELRKYDTSRGTIRFPAGKPLPAGLVTRMVKERIAENEAGKHGAGQLTGAGRARTSTVPKPRRLAHS